MKGKIISILVMMLLIATTLPAIGMTIKKIENEIPSPRNGFVDQEQTAHCGAGFPLSPPYWQAQEFKPTIEDLKLVKLWLFKHDTPPSGIKITVIIRDDLYGADLTSIIVNADDVGIAETGTWVKFDFDDILVIPETTYYIICYADGGDASDAYCWLFNEGNAYPRGIAWQSENGNNWYDLEDYFGYKEIDFCFKTYYDTSRDRTINSTFLKFLENHPNLLSIMEKILHRLRL